MKKVNEFLHGLISVFPKYVLSDEEKRQATQDIQAFVAKKLLRKKFRKQKLLEETRSDITNKVSLSIQENRPLHFAIPFGGYKHFWNPSHPRPDWAEFFTLHSLTEWLAPVLAVYVPGAIVEFISEDLILPRMNNYPEETLDQYAKGFSNLLDFYKKISPQNLRLEYYRLGDKFDKKKMTEEVEKILPTSWKKWGTYTEEQKEVELKRSKRSVLWAGKEDLTALTDQEKEKRTIESRLLELAYYEVEAQPEYLGSYFQADNHIPICFSFGLSSDNIDHWIVLGTTSGSIVDFWIGRGIIEDHENTYIPRIVSRKQYEEIQQKLRTQKVDILPLKNFQTVEVYPGILTFGQ